MSVEAGKVVGRDFATDAGPDGPKRVELTCQEMSRTQKRREYRLDGLAKSSQLQRECDTLTARGRVLLTDADAYLDGEMVAFIGIYLVALKQDFSEAVGTERESMLQLIIGELKDLVLEIQCRIDQGKAAKEQALN